MTAPALDTLLVLAKQAATERAWTAEWPTCRRCGEAITTDETSYGNGGHAAFPLCDQCAHEAAEELGKGVLFLIGEEQPYPNENAAQVLFRQGEELGRRAKEISSARALASIADEAIASAEREIDRMKAIESAELAAERDEGARLRERIQELLRDFQKLTREMPYAEEAKSTSTLIAEVGTLRARVQSLLTLNNQFASARVNEVAEVKIQAAKAADAYAELSEVAAIDARFFSDLIGGLQGILPPHTPATVAGIVEAVRGLRRPIAPPGAVATGLHLAERYAADDAADDIGDPDWDDIDFIAKAALTLSAEREKMERVVQAARDQQAARCSSLPECEEHDGHSVGCLLSVTDAALAQALVNLDRAEINDGR